MRHPPTCLVATQASGRVWVAEEYVLTKERGVKWNEAKYMMRSLVVCTHHLMLLGLLNQEDGVGWLSCEDEDLYIF
jgi:hypothetical protein